MTPSVPSDQPAPASPGPVAPVEAPSLEAALDRLDAIVREIEAGQLPLETLLEKYEEGILLSRLCEEKLTAAETRIRIITRDPSGNPALEEFNPTGEE